MIYNEEEKEEIRKLSKEIFIEVTKPLRPVLEFINEKINKTKGE